MRLASLINPNGVTACDSMKEDLRGIILTEKPVKILETGTYHGMGTTRTVLSALKEIPDHQFRFFSIEANPYFYLMALKNLKNEGIEVINGLSIPRELLPFKIDDDFPEDIITDHIDSKEYLKETNFRVRADSLRYALNKFDFQPNLVILDSAGHLGLIEFNYLMSMVRGEFILVLDDTLHRKHYKTLLKIKSQPEKWEVLIESKDKFGYAIVKHK